MFDSLIAMEHFILWNASLSITALIVVDPVFRIKLVNNMVSSTVSLKDDRIERVKTGISREATKRKILCNFEHLIINYLNIPMPYILCK